MLRKAVSLFSTCLIVTNIVNAVDPYCSKDLCPGGAPHIACGNNGRFSSTCPKNAKMIDEYTIRDSLFDAHNMNRDNLAGGYLPGYESAWRMRLMAWDDELAKMASFQVKRCQTTSTHCRNTKKYPRSGQNIGIISYTGSEGSRSDSQLIRNIFNSWWNQYKNGTMAVMKKYPQNRPVPRFALMANENNMAVGCAASRYTKNGKHFFLLACNYSISNTVGKPIYTAGPSAQGCTRPDFFLIHMCAPIDSS